MLTQVNVAQGSAAPKGQVKSHLIPMLGGLNLQPRQRQLDGKVVVDNTTLSVWLWSMEAPDEMPGHSRATEEANQANQEARENLAKTVEDIAFSAANGQRPGFATINGKALNKEQKAAIDQIETLLKKAKLTVSMVDTDEPKLEWFKNVGIPYVTPTYTDRQSDETRRSRITPPTAGFFNGDGKRVSLIEVAKQEGLIQAPTHRQSNTNTQQTPRFRNQRREYPNTPSLAPEAPQTSSATESTEPTVATTAEDVFAD